ncbi:hypothetical protein KR074_009755, partial [Drosophila pseudoananassae]
SEEQRAHNNLMMVVATLTWLLLSFITLLIYCCNYWQILRPHWRRQREEFEMHQQSTLLRVSVDD